MRQGHIKTISDQPTVDKNLESEIGTETEESDESLGIEIEDDEVGQTGDHQSNKEESKRVQRSPSIAYQYIVYLGSPSGIKAKVIRFDLHWRLLNSSASWVTLHSERSLTSRLAPITMPGGVEEAALVQCQADRYR